MELTARGLARFCLALIVGCAPQPSVVPLGGVDDPEPKRTAARADDEAAAAGSKSDGGAEVAGAAPPEPTDTQAKVELTVAGDTGQPDPAAEDSGAVDGDTTTFTERAIAEGDAMRTRITAKARGRMGMPDMGMRGDVDVTVTEDEKVEYLKVVDGKGVLSRVYFANKTMQGSIMGEDKSERSALIGNTYLIDESGDAATWKREDGRALSAEEEAELSERYGPDPDGESDDDEDYDFIPDRPLKKGESFPIPPEVRKAWMDEHADLLQGIRLRFDGVRDYEGTKVGVFKIEGTVSADIDGVEIEGTPRGEIWVAVVGKYPLRFEITGDVSADFSSAGMNMSGSGRFEIRGNATYDFAKP